MSAWCKARPWTADIPATIRQLDKLQPYSGHAIEELAALCTECSLVLCDIAPLGIAVAQSARRPSILVENFTWDWIYRPYMKRYPQLDPHARFLHKLFNQADYRIQTEPLCIRPQGICTANQFFDE